MNFQVSAQEEAVEKFLDAASRGDLTQVSTLLTHGPSLINQTGNNGWTALMLAARNGHFHVVEALLSNGYTQFFLFVSQQLNNFCLICNEHYLKSIFQKVII